MSIAPGSRFLVGALLLAGFPALAEDKPTAKSPAKAEPKSEGKPEAAAAPKAPPAPPKPAPELEAFAFLAGNFVCTGTAPANAYGPEHPYKAKFTSKWNLDKFFLTFQYSQLKAKDHPMPRAVEGYFGWDTGLKRHVFGDIDNVGVSQLFRTDKGAVELVFKGEGTEPSGRHVPAAVTFARTEKGFTWQVESADAEGNLAPVALDTCVKGK